MNISTSAMQICAASAIVAASLGISPAAFAQSASKDVQNRDFRESARYKYSGNPRIDSIVDNTKLIYTSGKAAHVNNDSVKSLISIFYMDQYRNAKDPDAPYFMFMSRDASMALGIGGALKLRAWYDWNGTVDSPGFSPYDIPIPKDPANRHSLGASPASSSLFFTLLGQHRKLGRYMGYIQAEFNGYHNIGCKLNKAYLIIQGWTVGYASSTFSDPAAEPPTVDGSGVNAKNGKTNMLVRYLHSHKRWTVSASVEFPSSKIQTSDFTAKSSDWLPDFVVAGQYDWDNNLSHVKLAGLLRSLCYRDLLTQRNHTVTGWGVQLSATVSTPSPITLFGIASVGAGHQSYNNDLSGDNYDLISDPYQNGHLYAPLSASYALGMRYSISKDFVASLALGEVNYHPKHRPDPMDYKYGLYGAANLFWFITPRLQVGGEYVIGQRKNFNGQHGSVNRIDALLQLNF